MSFVLGLSPIVTTLIVLLVGSAAIIVASLGSAVAPTVRANRAERLRRHESIPSFYLHRHALGH